jgi:hypothetical protein
LFPCGSIEFAVIAERDFHRKFSLDRRVVAFRDEASDFQPTFDIVLWGKFRPGAFAHARQQSGMTTVRGRMKSDPLFPEFSPETAWHTGKRLHLRQSVHVSPSGSAT